MRRHAGTGRNMGIYDLAVLFLGIFLIALVFVRFDISRTGVLVFLVLAIAAYLAVFFSVHHHIRKSCVILADESLSDIRSMIMSWGPAAPLLSVLLMVLQAVIAPLPAFLITAANGLVFGVYWGTLISWTGAMGGALVSFMISRLFFETFTSKIRGHRKGIEYIERFSTKYGFRVILTARLLPFISFDVISYAAGLSTIKARTFLLATGIGMIPATIVYTAFGAEMGKMKAYSEMLFTSSVLAVLLLILVWTVQGVYRRRTDSRRIQDRDGNNT
ncbi:MAG: TVP38/TMEM64 family protein [Nitrospiraceae bacterium]|nr:MAG: TVP38/TMEM64 family protein [Nitrospiraceae bacterium]